MFDFIIIGGGIIGLLTAKELQKTGAKVAVIEKNSPGQQATWAAGGILSPMRPWHYSEPVNAISNISQAIYQQLATELLQHTGIDPEWTLSGMLVLNDEDLPPAIDWCQQRQVQHKVLTSKQLNARFSYLNLLNEPALLRDDVATIRPHRLLAALNKYLADKGVTFYNAQQVQRLITKDRAITGAQINDEILYAGEYIICSGAWSPKLVPELSSKPDISPVKGQMICFPPIDLADPCMVMDGDRYFIPRKDGRVVVGSTREHTGFNADTSQQAFDDLRDFAQQLFPALQAVQPDAHWAGLRPSSPDSIPYICRVAPYTNLSLNAGHYRNGIVTAPASAELIADILLHRPSKLDHSAYQLTR
jgi:glycine oxidase|tara:strand:+ start:17196 stop:18278 length:1083 start_codon:yes stop_codon:yes gene_type:complete